MEFQVICYYQVVENGRVVKHEATRFYKAKDAVVATSEFLVWLAKFGTVSNIQLSVAIVQGDKNGR